jgi:hypothetical protein
MQLSEDALKLASEEMNRLAKQKADLEKYLEQIGPMETDAPSFREQALFVENQMRLCMQGWAKATPAVRKRLLRRTIKEILVTRTEMRIVFWLGIEKDFDENGNPIEFGTEGLKNVKSLRRVSHQASDRNLSIKSSGNVGIGRPLPTTCKFLQQHDFTEYFEETVENIFAQTAPLYQKGHSLKEISVMTGFPYTTIRDQLVKGGVTLRINKSVSSTEVLRQTFKNSAAPPFGYYYLDGGLVKDPKEYPTLQMIDQLRRRGNPQRQLPTD